MKKYLMIIFLFFKRLLKKKKDAYLEYKDIQFYDFILKAQNKEIADNAYYVFSEKINDELAREISDIVGFDVSNYRNLIEPSEVRHIIKEHGQNGTSDSSMSNLHDLEKIEYVIENWNSIGLGKGSKKYKNKDNTRAKTIVIQKKIADNYYYVVEAVPNNARKSMYVVSAYINKNDTLSNVAVSRP